MLLVLCFGTWAPPLSHSWFPQLCWVCPGSSAGAQTQAHCQTVLSCVAAEPWLGAAGCRRCHSNLCSEMTVLLAGTGGMPAVEWLRIPAWSMRVGGHSSSLNKGSKEPGRCRIQ